MSPARDGRRGLVSWLGRLVGALAGGYLGYVAYRGSRLLVRPDVRPFVPDVDGGPETPGDIGLAYEDVRFTTDDGVTLAGWLVPAARETRAAVIVMHGFSGHRLADLAYFVPWLQRRYHVLQFDFRGHGASDAATTTLGSLERRDVAAAAHYLQGRGMGPVALLGVSMGAAIAVVAAPDLPVAAVVADAPYAELHHPIAVRLREQRYPLAGLGARAIVAAAALRARTLLLSPIHRVRRIAPRGLLLIAGREDALISWRQALKLYDAAEEPKELYVVDGAIHGQCYATAPLEYERRVLGFLSRHLDGDAEEEVRPGETPSESARLHVV